MNKQLCYFRTLATACSVISLSACQNELDNKHFTGYVEAEYVYVSSPDSGWLIDVPFREGDEINFGNTLFELDKDRQQAEYAEAADRLKQNEAQVRDAATGARREEINSLQAQLNEAQATLQFAQAERIRWTELVAKNLASQSRADQVISEANVASARVRTIEANIAVARLTARDGTREAAAAGRDAAADVLAQAQWRLDQRTVSARVNGRIEQVFHRQGEYVNAGIPVLAILPEDALKIRFFVPQMMLSKLSLGANVNIALTEGAQPATAQISFIAREAEFTPPVIYSEESRDKLVFLVEARLLDTAGLRPGQPIDIYLP